MFFILSKTLNFLILPLTLVFIFFMLSFFIRNQRLKRRFFWIAFILLAFFSNDFISNEVMRAWEIDAIPFSEMRPYGVGIVLTGTTESFVKPDDRVYFKRGADRVTHTLQLYKLGLIKRILVSGGSGRILKEDEPEANKYKRVLLLAGVNETDIILENKTRNTHESAVAVKYILDSLQVRPEECLLITSAFHMRRSLACYHKAGLNVVPFSTDFYGLPEKFFLTSLLIPNIEGFIIWEKLFKEWVGLMAYKMAGYV